MRDFASNPTYIEEQINVGMKLSVQGVVSQDWRENHQNLSKGVLNGNHALFILNGDIAGMRPVLTVATANRALSKMECVVVCRADVTLTLPSDPEIGQYYKIIKRASAVTINGNGKNITYGVKNIGVVYKTEGSCILDKFVQDSELFFDGELWRCLRHFLVE